MTFWCPKRWQWGLGNTEDSYDGGCRLTQAVLTTRTLGSLEQRLPGWAWHIAEELEPGWHHWKEPGWSHQHCCVAVKKRVTQAAGVFLRSARRVTVIHLIVTPVGPTHPLFHSQQTEVATRKVLLSSSCQSSALTKDQARKACTELNTCF